MRWGFPRALLLMMCAALGAGPLAGCQTLHARGQSFRPEFPRELDKASLPYAIETPDILRIDLIRAVPPAPDRIEAQALSGEYAVRADGTIGLGSYGSVYVSGMAIDHAQIAVQAHLAQYLVDPRVTLDVLACKSKAYYVIFDGGDDGQRVVRVPCTGNETVLDAVSRVNGLPPASAKKQIWLARPAPAAEGRTEILTVDWDAIAQRGSAATNYQVLAGDRIYVRTEPASFGFHAGRGRSVDSVQSSATVAANRAGSMPRDSISAASWEQPRAVRPSEGLPPVAMESELVRAEAKNSRPVAAARTVAPSTELTRSYARTAPRAEPPIQKPASSAATAAQPSPPPAAAADPIRTLAQRPEPPARPAEAPPPPIVAPAAARPTVQGSQEQRVPYRVESNTRPEGAANVVDPFRSSTTSGPSQVVDPFRAPEAGPEQPPVSERDVQPFSVPSQDRTPVQKRTLRGLFSPRQ